MGLREAGIAAAALAAVSWVAYFLLASRLGLYQDDVWMYYIVRFAHGGILDKAFELSRNYGGDGRPLTQPVMVLSTWLGSRMGGVTGLYVLNWILLTAQVLLAYSCLRHFFRARACLLAAAFLALFPADAAKFFIVSYMGWVGTALFWIALLLLLRRRIVLSVLVLASTFAMSEAFILPGALLPLLLIADGREDLPTSLRRAARFAACFALIMVPAVVLRLVYAPGRAAQALDQFDRWMLFKRIVGSVYFGTAASARALWARVHELLLQGDLLAWGAAAVVAAILLLAAYRLRERAAFAPGATGAAALRPLWIVAFGLLAWLACYPLYGMYPARFPPSIVDGKLSNVHEQAALGGVWLAGLLFHAAESSLLRRGFAALAAAYLGLVAGYFVTVQERYVEEWQHELSFWRWLPAAVDLKPDSLVVVEPVGAEATRLDGASPFDWTLPHLFRFMWRPPTTWEHQPLIIHKQYYDRLAHAHPDGRVDVWGYLTMMDRTYLPSDITFLRAEPDRFVVLDGPSGHPVPGRAPAGFPLFSHTLRARGSMVPGELQQRAARSTTDFTIYANDYSSGPWRRGVSLGSPPGQGGFYFVVDNEDANPLRAGDVVRFAHAGTAHVLHVDGASQGGRFSVFVTVDRPLDPDADGFPHPIHVRP